MSTFGTVSSAVSREAYNPTNALKNCAPTAAKINVPKATQLGEFRHFRSSYLEFYIDRARPPLFAFAQSPAHPAAEGRVRSVGEFMTCWHTEARNDYGLRPQAAYPP